MGTRLLTGKMKKVNKKSKRVDYDEDDIPLAELKRGAKRPGKVLSIGEPTAEENEASIFCDVFLNGC